MQRPQCHARDSSKHCQPEKDPELFARHMLQPDHRPGGWVQISHDGFGCGKKEISWQHNITVAGSGAFRSLFLALHRAAFAMQHCPVDEVPGRPEKPAPTSYFARSSKNP